MDAEAFRQAAEARAKPVPAEGGLLWRLLALLCQPTVRAALPRPAAMLSEVHGALEQARHTAFTLARQSFMFPQVKNVACGGFSPGEKLR